MADNEEIQLKTGRDCLRMLGLPPEEGWTIERLAFEDIPEEKRELAMRCARCKGKVPAIEDDMILDQHNRPYCPGCGADIMIGYKESPDEKKS